MRIEEFLWVQTFVDKLAMKHGVEVDEVEEVFNNMPRIRFVEKGTRPDEDLYLALGQTDSGRYLSIHFILKPKRVACVITARELPRRKRKRYDKK